MSGVILRGVVLALLLGAAGCAERPRWRLKDVSGVVAPLELELSDDRGRQVSEADFRGKVVMLFFGYLSCPDVCPATLVRLSEAVRRLGERAGEVRVLFVSVDPRRDTLAALRAYVAAFAPQVVGLRGEEPVLRRLTRRYRVTYGYGEPDEDGFYLVSHSSAVFIFDRQGRARLLATSGDPVEAIAADLRRLVEAG